MAQLSPNDEEIAEKYRKMLRMGTPEGAVMQRMAADGVEPHIEGAVLDSTAAKPLSSGSFIEEEILSERDDDDDAVVEEEIIDDSEVEDEIEEEIVVEDDDGGQEISYHDDRQGNEQDHTRDVENPYNSQFQYRQEVQEQARIPKPKTPVKKLATPSPVWYWITCFLMLGFVGAAVGVAYWLTTNDKNVNRIEPDVGTNAPTPTPVEVSTRFSSIQGRCSGISSLDNPNPVDQCDCFGEIGIIPSDVRASYRYNVDVFIPLYYEEWNEDISSCSAQNIALVWTSSVPDLDQTNRTQLYAMSTTFAALGGSDWANRNGWLTYTDPCRSWSGVACDNKGRVTQLDLNENNAAGTIPGEVGLLEGLEVISAFRNNIEGPVPRALFMATSLRLVNLSANRLTGALPSSVGQATNLNVLNLESNLMSGRLSASLGQCTALSSLIVNTNAFEGEIPSEILEIRSLVELDLGGNQFFGTIPTLIGQLTNLEFLTLGPNQLSGTLETSIRELTNLQFLSIRGIDVTGRLPADYASLTSLVDLIISDTSVEGDIDPSYATLPNLTNIDLSGNNLRGVIPAEFGSTENLVSIALDGNFLTGQIPSTLGSATALQAIRLNGNLLEGRLPVSIGNLSSLRILRLESNRFQDRVAQEICDLREEDLFEFVVDCPIQVGGESLGVQCPIPECCTNCVPLA